MLTSRYMSRPLDFSIRSSSKRTQNIMLMMTCRRNFLKFSKSPRSFCAPLKILWTQRALRESMLMIGSQRRRWGASWCLKTSLTNSQCIERMWKVASKGTSRSSTIALIRKLRVLMHQRNPSVQTIQSWRLSRSENRRHDDKECAAQGGTTGHKMAYSSLKCQPPSEFTSFARQIGQHKWWRRRIEHENSDDQRRQPFQIKARYSNLL